MGITFQPSLLQQLGGPASLDQLGDAIAHIVNPNYKLQKEVQEAISLNPKLGQALRDQEANAPGFLKNLGLGPLGDSIGNLPESIDNQYLRTKRAQILGQEGEKLDTQGKQLDLQNLDIDGMIKELQGASPAEAKDIFMNRLGIGTAAEQRSKTAEADTREAGVAGAKLQEGIDKILQDYAPQLATSQLNQSLALGDRAKLARQEYEDTLAKYDSLKGIDPMTAVENTMAGRPTPNIANLFQLQGFSEAYSKGLQTKDLELRLREQENIKRLTLGGREQDKQMLEADRMYTQSGGRGSFPAWLEALQNPGAVKAAQAKDPTQRSYIEQDLVRIGEYQNEKETILKNQGIAKNAATVQSINNQINKTRIDLDRAITAYKGNTGDQADIQGALGPYAQAMESKAALTGIHILPKYGPIPPVNGVEGDTQHTFRHPATGPTGLYFIDAQTGKRVEDKVANNYINNADPSIVKSDESMGKVAPTDEIASPINIKTEGLSKQAAAFYAGYNKDTSMNHRKENAAALKTQMPNVYNELLARGLFK